MDTPTKYLCQTIKKCDYRIINLFKAISGNVDNNLLILFKPFICSMTMQFITFKFNTNLKLMFSHTS